MHRVLTLSGVELAALIRNRELTSREVVEAHIAKLEAVNATLNALVEDRYEAARAEADAADAAVAAGAPEAERPFHGVPCTIKESIALEGMPQTAGLVGRKGSRSSEDAVTVARWRAAGAIPLGVTNTSELCMWMESDNKVYGRTNNPYDPTRIVGGSSGGEGAVVGAGASPFGLGADVGGSIRMPAFFNGVFGHKPSSLLVPNSGQHPPTGGPQNLLLCTGPITRRAEDLFPLLSALAGPEDEDCWCEAMELKDPATVDLSALRVLDVADNGVVKVSDELQASQRRVARHLESLGAKVEQVRIEELESSLQIWSSMMDTAAEHSFAEMLGQGEPVSAGLELLKFMVGRSDHTLPAIGLALLEKVTSAFPGQTQKMCELGDALRADLEGRLDDDAVMLYPPYSTTAPKHGGPLFPPIDWMYTAILNAMQLPVTQVPLGLDRGGLPLGVQVAAARGNDHLTIAVALELERAFGGWVMPRSR